MKDFINALKALKSATINSEEAVKALRDVLKGIENPTEGAIKELHEKGFTLTDEQEKLLDSIVEKVKDAPNL